MHCTFADLGSNKVLLLLLLHTLANMAAGELVEIGFNSTSDDQYTFGMAFLPANVSPGTIPTAVSPMDGGVVIV